MSVTNVQAISNLINSVAEEEAAISNIIAAEANKITTVANMPNVTPSQLIAVNQSVKTTINLISRLESTLQSKLEMYSSQINA